MNDETEHVDLTQLTVCVSNLQRHVRILGILLVCVTCVFFAAATPKILAPATALGDDNDIYEVGGFVLKDEGGQIRGAWLVNDDGGVSFTLTDPGGNPRLVLEVDKDGLPRILLADRSGNPRGTWSVDDDKSTTFQLTGVAGGAVMLVATKDGYSHVGVNDQSGKQRGALAVKRNGDAISFFNDRKGRTTLMLGSLGDGSSVIFFPDPGGNLMVPLGGWYTDKGSMSPFPK